MGNVLSANDTLFRWEYTDQPHAQRRIQILRKYPEIKKYMRANGDPVVAMLTVFMVALHIFLSYITYRLCPGNMIMSGVLGVFVGSYVASWIILSLHEAAHCLVFGPAHPRLNRIFGLIINLVLMIPMFSYFKRYHRRHHKYLGDEELDTDHPTLLEAKIFSVHWITKYIFMVYTPILHHIRTAFLANGTADWLSMEQFINNITCIAANIFLFRYGYEYACGYFMLSTFVALGTNVIGMWATTAHCLYFHKQETVSYYGWLNIFMLNFGYHEQHHDFPNIPSRYLPEVKRIAWEFYEEQWHMDSMYSATLQFIHDPRLGLYSRLKRDQPTMKHPNSGTDYEFS